MRSGHKWSININRNKLKKNGRSAGVVANSCVASHEAHSSTISIKWSVAGSWRDFWFATTWTGTFVCCSSPLASTVAFIIRICINASKFNDMNFDDISIFSVSVFIVWAQGDRTANKRTKCDDKNLPIFLRRNTRAVQLGEAITHANTWHTFFFTLFFCGFLLSNENVCAFFRSWTLGELSWCFTAAS